jgi:hypothetical protein
MLNQDTRPVIGNGKITLEVKKGRYWKEIREIINLGDLVHEHNDSFKPDRCGRQRIVQYTSSGRMEWGSSSKELKNDESNGNAVEGKASNATDSLSTESSES